MMFCARCGKQIDDDSTFCPFCGQQVDAPVTGTKFNIPFKEGISTQAKKWMIGAVAGLVAITGVTVGAVKLMGGSGDKEPVVSEVEESKPAAELPAEAPAPTEAPAEEPVSEEPVDDSLHTVSKYEISNILQEFFQAHLGCYISYCYGNCKTVPKDVSSMQEHVLGPVSTIDLARMVVPDYDDSSFYMEISTNDISKETHNNDTVNYRCSVSIEDINIYGNTFTYYEGTDAEIGVVAKLNYIVNDKSMDISNNYVACVLDNSTSNPDEWLIAAAVFTNQSAYEKNKGNIFEKMLSDENMDSSVAESVQNTDWKQKYLSIVDGDDRIVSYQLKDLNGDGVPELWGVQDDLDETTMFYYIKPDNTVEEIWNVRAYSENKLRVHYETANGIIDDVYEFDSSTGEYTVILSGGIYMRDVDEPEYGVTGDDDCTEEEYNSKFNSLFDYNSASSLLDNVISTSDKPIKDAILEY